MGTFVGLGLEERTCDDLDAPLLDLGESRNLGGIREDRNTAELGLLGEELFHERATDCATCANDDNGGCHGVSLV